LINDLAALGGRFVDVAERNVRLNQAIKSGVATMTIANPENMAVRLAWVLHHGRFYQLPIFTKRLGVRCHRTNASVCLFPSLDAGTLTATDYAASANSLHRGQWLRQ
jgi:hypothetical protein